MKNHIIIKKSQRCFKFIISIIILITFTLSSYAQRGTCSGLTTFYQTVGSPTTQDISIYKYNGFSQFEKIHTLTPQHSGNHTGAAASAYSSVTGYLYVADDPSNNLTLRVYNPANNFQYVGRITFSNVNSTNKELQGFNNLFTTPDGRIGMVNNNYLLMANLSTATPTSSGAVNVLTGTKRSLGTPNNSSRSAADYVWFNDRIYGMSVFNIESNIAQLVVINPSNNTRTLKPITFPPGTFEVDNERPYLNTFGAIWIDTSGSLYFSNNASGIIYRIENVLTNTNAVPVYISTETNFNDGFACAALDLRPTVTTVPPTCSTQGYATIDDYDPINYSYSFIPATPGISISSSGQVSGLIIGQSYILNKKTTNPELYYDLNSTAFTIPGTEFLIPPTPILTSTKICSPETTGTIILTNLTAGVTYKLYKSDNTLLSAATFTDAAGKRTWNNIALGNYYVTAELPTACSIAKTTVSVTNGTIPIKPLGIVIRMPTCVTPTGDIKITNYIATNHTYTIRGTIITPPSTQPKTYTPIVDTFYNLPPDTYTLTVQNIDGCKSSESSQIVVPGYINDTSVPTAEVTTHIDCANPTGTITVTPPTIGTGIQYILKGPLPSLSEKIQPTPLFSGLSKGTYTIKYKMGVCDSDETMPLTIESTNEPEILVDNQDINCQILSGKITIQQPLGAYKYKLEGIGENTYNSGLTLATSFEDLPAGSYKLTAIKDADNCATVKQPIIILSDNVPPVKPVVGNIFQPTCIELTGSFEVTSPLNPPSMSLYEYHLVHSTDPSLNKTQESPIFTVIPQGTYRLKVINKISVCESIFSDDFNITPDDDNVPPPIPNLEAPSICRPALTGTIFLNNPKSGATYTLYDEFDQLVADAEVTELDGQIMWSDVPVANNYYVVADLQKGCATSTSSIDITYKFTPDEPEAILSRTPTCLDSSGDITITNYNEDLNYSLLGSIITAPNTQPNTYYPVQDKFINLPIGNYVLLVETDEGCSSLQNFDINIPQYTDEPSLPQATVTVNIDCLNDKGTIVVQSPEPATGIQYILSGPTPESIDQIQNDPIFTDLSAGTYSLKIKKGICTSPTLYPLTVENILEPVILHTTQNPNCQSSFGSITINQPLGDYLYKLEGTGSTLYSSEPQLSPVFDGLSPGTYKVTLEKISNSCITSKDNITIINDNQPPVVPTFTYTHQPDCFTEVGSIIVNSPIGDNIEYILKHPSDPTLDRTQNSRVFTNLSPGTYHLIATNLDNHCVSEQSSPIIMEQIPTLPLPGINVLPQQNCTNEKSGSIIITTLPNYEYSLTYVNTTNIPSLDDHRTNGTGVFMDLRAGDYQIKIRDLSSNCESSTTRTVLPYNDLPILNHYYAVQPTCGVRYGEINISQNATQYSFDGGLTFGSLNRISNLSPGMYYLKIKDDKGCISLPIEVEIEGLPLIPENPRVTVSQPSCEDDYRSLYITNFDSDVQYILTGVSPVRSPQEITSDTIPNIESGTYLLKATSKISLCEALTSTPFTVNTTICPNIRIVKTGHFNDENKDGYAAQGESISYTFTITNTGNTTLTNITLKDILPGIRIITKPGTLTLQPGAIDSTFFRANYSIKISDIVNSRVENNAQVSGDYNGGTVTDNSTIIIPLDKSQFCNIKVYNFIKPDSNSESSSLEISGIECYPDNSLEIYNRWGVLVFHRKPYDNSSNAFVGHSEGRATIDRNQQLPSGTYYYILKYKDELSTLRTKTGYLYLKR